VTAVQFHPEFTHERVTAMASRSEPVEFAHATHVQQPEEFLSAPERFDVMREHCLMLLDRALLAT
jgi:hypothetical protein